MSNKNETDDAADDDVVLTKTKKPRSEAQIAAFEKARAIQAAKRDERQTAATGRAPDPDKERKKIILQAVKEKLNGEPKSKAPPVVDETTEEDVSEEEAAPPPKKAVKKAAPPPPPIKAKKEPKVVYEESESDEEPAPPKKAEASTRETKTQMNKSMFKVTPGKTEAPKSIYYFAD